MGSDCRMHVCKEKSVTYFGRKIVKKILLEIRGCMWKDNIEMDCVGVDWEAWNGILCCRSASGCQE